MTDKQRIQLRIRDNLIATGVLALVSLFLFLLAWLIPHQGFYKFYIPFSRKISGMAGFVVSFLPTSVAELLLYALIGVLVYRLVRAIMSAISHTSGVFYLLHYGTILLVTSAWLVVWFLVFWGFNYYAPPVETRLEMEVQVPTQPLLVETTWDLLAKLNDVAPLVTRDADGVMDAGYKAISSYAVSAYEQLGENDSRFAGGTISPPKRIFLHIFQDYLHIAGIYSPFTGESNVNANAPDAMLSFSMLHEMAHRLGFAHEDDANFVAFLTGVQAEQAEMRYTAYFNAFTYCINEIRDQNVRSQILSEVTPFYWLEWDRNAKIREETKLNESVESVTATVSEAVNDGYLKANGQENGTESYDRFVDLLVAWYQKKQATEVP